MGASEAIDLTRQAIMLVVILAAPALLVSLAVGLIVSLLQAITQVQEQTLSFVPKIIATLAALVFFGPWMIARAVEFGRSMFAAVP